MNHEPLASVRRRFAEELRAACGLTTDRLVAALAAVPRERFCGPGPWRLRGPGDPAQGRMTESDDARLLYADVSVALDADRELFNGQPGLVARWIEALGVAEGHRVAHIGSGTGYYSAVLAEIVGPAGHVTAVEIDADLARRAREALSDRRNVTVVHGDGRRGLPSPADVLLVHAGATHLLDEWLNTLADPGRMLVPLSCAIPGMPATLGKGTVLIATRQGGDWRARLEGLVIIYSLIGGRDEAMNARLGSALFAGTAGSVTRLRRDAHDEGTACWLHGATTCLSA